MKAKDKYPRSYARRLERMKMGNRMYHLLRDGGWQAIRGLAERVAYGGSCPPDAPCRCAAREALEEISRKHRKDRGARWRPDDLAEARRRWESGERASSIGEDYCVTANAIRRLANRYGWASDPTGHLWSEEEIETARDMWDSGKPTRAIAKTVGRTMIGVQEMAVRMGWKRRWKPWTTEELNKAKKMRADGEATPAISKVLGRSYEAVRRKLAQERSPAGPRQGGIR